MISPKTRQVIGFPRAHRIALLVDFNKVSINQIEKWITFCMQKWGGRFYPFIPVNGSSLFPRSEDLLRGCDPDYIISHEDISTDFKKKIQEISSPLKICAVRQDNPLSSIVNLESCLKIPYCISQRFSFSRISRYYYLVGSDIFDDIGKKFLGLNFGFYPDISLLKGAFERSNGIEIPISQASLNIPAFLEDLITYPQSEIFFPIDFCKEWAQSAYKHQENELTKDLHVVVGNTISEILYVWNRIHNSSNTHGRDIIWIPHQFFSDPKLLKSISDWINYSYFGHRASIISFSHDEKELKKLQKLFIESCEGRLFVNVGALSLDKIPIIYNGNEWNPCRKDFEVCKYFDLKDNPIIFPISHPSLTLPKEDKFFSPSKYMIDWMIASHPNGVMNNSGWLKLPQRPNVANAFFGSNHRCKITTTGFPSLEVNTAVNHIEIMVPSLENILYQCSVDEVDIRKEKFTFKLSEPGTKLLNLIELFGGLDEVKSFFEDPFLIHLTKTMLPYRIKNNNKDNTLDRKDQKKPYLSHGQIKERLNEFNGVIPEYKKKYKQYYAYCIEDLYKKNILFAGIEQICPKCFLKQWYLYPEKGELTCICKNSFKVSFDPTWYYKLHNIVADAFYNSYIHVARFLWEFEMDIVQRGGSSFEWLSSVSIHLPGIANALTDLDFTLLVNKGIRIGEVKAAPEMYEKKDFETLYTIATLIKPNVIYICAIGEKWPENIADEIENLRTRLKKENRFVIIKDKLLSPISFWKTDPSLETKASRKNKVANTCQSTT